ncbi:MAG: glucosamine-6-phosphate deaminase [Chitinophagaceae bacterium]|nr:glucosamine-6-phosphate deaminase [Chitinophagaceae bacterium]
MQLEVYHNHEEQSNSAAELMIETIINKPNAVITLATGDSPKLAYQLFVEKVIDQGVDISQVFFTGLDEWVDVAPTNPGSCYFFLHQYIFSPLKLSASQYHLFKSAGETAGADCQQMNQVLSAKGGIDLMVVGVGMNGHIGFNEPRASLENEAHVAQLEPVTLQVGQKYFDGKTPIQKGMTLGLKQVMGARTLLAMANGEKKASIIQTALEGTISNLVPISLIRQHTDGIVMLDEAAASLLKN